VLAEDAAREAARKRVEAKRGLLQTAVTFGIVWAVLIVIWALTDSDSFWPIWPILGMSVALAFQAWGVYGRKPITDADIDRELRRGEGGAS
jgi:4-hydroxybenzoate polyprenyltransferase